MFECACPSVYCMCVCVLAYVSKFEYTVRGRGSVYVCKHMYCIYEYKREGKRKKEFETASISKVL